MEELANKCESLMSNFYKTLDFPEETAYEVTGNKNFLIEITKVLAD